jgi:hypothetical protein
MGLFSWVGSIFKFLIGTVKSMSGDLGRDARIEGRIGHRQEKIRKENLSSQIDAKEALKEDLNAIEISNDILTKNSLAEQKTRELKSKVKFFIKDEIQVHVVEAAQEEFTQILNFLKVLITKWKKIEDHIEKEVARVSENFGSHQKIREDLKYEFKYLRQEVRVLKRERKNNLLHSKEKMAILLRRRVLFNELMATNTQELEELKETTTFLKKLLSQIANHLTNAMRLETRAGIRSWNNFSKYLDRLDTFFYDDDKELALNIRLFLQTQGKRMEEFRAKIQADAHKIATLAVLQKEYDSFLIEEESKVQQGTPQVPTAA